MTVKKRMMEGEWQAASGRWHSTEQALPATCNFATLAIE
jgi:hypothetical protein